MEIRFIRCLIIDVAGLWIVGGLWVSGGYIYEALSALGFFGRGVLSALTEIRDEIRKVNMNLVAIGRALNEYEKKPQTVSVEINWRTLGVILDEVNNKKVQKGKARIR